MSDSQNDESDTEARSGLLSMFSTLDRKAIQDFDQVASDGGCPRPTRVLWTMQAGEPRLMSTSGLDDDLIREIAATIAASRPADVAAMLPGHLILLADKTATHPYQALLLSDRQLTTMLPLRPEAAPLSQSETHLLKQLICGYTLAEAARADAVSHETKRSQFKGLAGKTGARSQVALVSRALTSIALQCETPPNRPATGAAPPHGLRPNEITGARLHMLTGPSGLTHRFIDIGPASGDPLILLHSQVLPDLREEDIGFLQDQNLRVILPLRNGALDRDANPLSPAEHVDHACEATDLAVRAFGAEDAHLMGCVSGCAFALEYARRHPARVATLALVGAPVRPNTGQSVAGRLRFGMLKLAGTNWALYSRALRFYGKRLEAPGALRDLLMRVYRNNAADLQVIRAEFASPGVGDRLTRHFTTSVESIKHDFYHQACPNWERPATDGPAIALIHGTRDFIHAIEDVRALATSWGDVPVLQIDDAGQLLYHRHFAPLIRQYMNFRTQA